MTYAAWFDIHRDPVVTRRPVAMRVYAALVAEQTAFYAPQEVKAWAMAERLRVKTDSVCDALAVLIARGYLVDHGRNDNKVRRVTIAFERDHPRNRDTLVA